MRDDRKLPPLALGLVILILIPFIFTGDSKFDKAAAAQLGGALMTFLAVIVALYMEELRRWLHPPRAELYVPCLDGVHEPIGLFGDYVYHLKIRNCRPDRPIQNCHMVLTGFQRLGTPLVNPPVERFFAWAPSEAGETFVTVWHERTLDFGRINDGLDGKRDMSTEFVDPHTPQTDRFFLTFLKFANPSDPSKPRVQGGYLPTWVFPGQSAVFQVELRGDGFRAPYDISVFWDGKRSPNMREHLKITIRNSSETNTSYF